MVSDQHPQPPAATDATRHCRRGRVRDHVGEPGDHHLASDGHRSGCIICTVLAVWLLLFLAFLGYGGLNNSFNTMTDVLCFCPSTRLPNHPSLICSLLIIEKPTHTHRHTHTHTPTTSSHIPVPLSKGSVSWVGEWGWTGPDQTRQSGSEPPPAIQHGPTRLHACIRSIHHTGLNNTVLSCPMTR